MESILIRSQYKVTQVLYVEADYAALLAVDIKSKDQSEYLLNIYEGSLGKTYAGIYEGFRHCPQYVGIFITEGALVAVYTYKRGEEIDEVFYKGAAYDWQVRLHYAQLLFHLALSVSDFPPEIGCAAFLPSNLSILKNDMALSVNYIASPISDVNERELIYMLSDNILKVLPRRFQMAAAEISFLDKLESGYFTSVAALYSAWQAVSAELHMEYEKAYKMNALQRLLHFAAVRFRRLFARRK